MKKIVLFAFMCALFFSCKTSEEKTDHVKLAYFLISPELGYESKTDKVSAPSEYGETVKENIKEKSSGGRIESENHLSILLVSDRLIGEGIRSYLGANP